MNNRQRTIIAAIWIGFAVFGIWALGQSVNFTLPSTMPAGTVVTFTPPAAPPIVTPPIVPPPTTQPTPPTTQPTPPIGNVPGAAIQFTTVTDKYQTLEPVCVNLWASKFTPAQIWSFVENWAKGNQPAVMWNFGDTGAEYNSVPGFNAVHVYATPTTYTITLTITLSPGQTSVASVPVTIVTRTENVRQIAPGAAFPIAAATGDVIEFQKGQTYTSSAGFVNVNGASHVLIASYGSGAQPILKNTAPTSVQSDIITNASTSALVIDGITFDSTYPLGGAGTPNNNVISPSMVGNGGVALIDDTFLNVTSAYNGQLPNQNKLMQDCSAPTPDAINGYLIYDVGTDGAAYGNVATDCFNQAIIRLVSNSSTAPSNWSFAFNNLNKSAAVNGKNCFTLQYGRWIYCYQNVTVGNANPGGNGSGVSFLTATDGEIASQNIQYVVEDSNNETNQCTTIQNWAQHIAIVGNSMAICPVNVQAIQINSSGGSNATNDIFIEGNKFSSTASAPLAAMTIANPSATNIAYVGNTFADPNCITGNASGFVNFQCGSLSGFSVWSGNQWPSIPSSQVQWPNGGVMFSVNNGSVPSDYWTPTQLEQQTLSNGSHPTGDVYAN
jgi:hypothetical protein